MYFDLSEKQSFLNLLNEKTNVELKEQDFHIVKLKTLDKVVHPSNRNTNALLSASPNFSHFGQVNIQYDRIRLNYNTKFRLKIKASATFEDYIDRLNETHGWKIDYQEIELVAPFDLSENPIISLKAKDDNLRLMGEGDFKQTVFPVQEISGVYGHYVIDEIDANGYRPEFTGLSGMFRTSLLNSNPLFKNPNISLITANYTIDEINPEGYRPEVQGFTGMYLSRMGQIQSDYKQPNFSVITANYTIDEINPDGYRPEINSVSVQSLVACQSYNPLLKQPNCAFITGNYLLKENYKPNRISGILGLYLMNAPTV